MAWVGTGVLYTVSAGVLRSETLSPAGTPQPGKAGFRFAQISDSHMGFNKPANTDVVGTLKTAVGKINALETPPEFLLHTGDITQLAKPDEFDTAKEVLKGVKADRIFYVPGEHDVATDNGASYLQRYGKGTKGSGWYMDGGPRPANFAAKFLLTWPGLDRCSTIGFRCAADLGTT